MTSTLLRQFCHIPVRGSSILSNSGCYSKFTFFMPQMEQVRTIIRKHFYRPSERLRLIKHGWQTRLKTPGGRAVIMRRILKGRFVLSH